VAPPDIVVEYQAYLEVRDRSSRELVTVLDLLSPTNKGRHRDQYLRKRDQVLASTAHLVEIDLLRGGDPMPAPDRPGCDYLVTVSRAERRPEADFWPVRLRERLPVIPVPLRAPVQDATLDLQELLHRVYSETSPSTTSDANWPTHDTPSASTPSPSCSVRRAPHLCTGASMRNGPRRSARNRRPWRSSEPSY
jgi:Protein of unknown function (DUF4058)